MPDTVTSQPAVPLLQFDKWKLESPSQPAVETPVEEQGELDTACASMRALLTQVKDAQGMSSPDLLTLGQAIDHASTELVSALVDLADKLQPLNVCGPDGCQMPDWEA